MKVDPASFGDPVPFLRTSKGEVWSEFLDKPAGDRWRRLAGWTPNGRVCLPVELFELDEDVVDQDARDDRRIVVRRRFDRLFADTLYLATVFPGAAAALDAVSERVRSAVCSRLARGYDPGGRMETE